MQNFETDESSLSSHGLALCYVPVKTVNGTAPLLRIRVLRSQLSCHYFELLTLLRKIDAPPAKCRLLHHYYVAMARGAKLQVLL